MTCVFWWFACRQRQSTLSVNAWQETRDAIDGKFNWQFTKDACVKLRRLYTEYLRQDNGQASAEPTTVYNL
jgi:hypothetical protein